MLKITMFNKKWRIAVEGEEWEFPDAKTMKKTFDDLVELKSKYGRDVLAGKR